MSDKRPLPTDDGVARQRHLLRVLLFTTIQLAMLLGLCDRLAGPPRLFTLLLGLVFLGAVFTLRLLLVALAQLAARGQAVGTKELP